MNILCNTNHHYHQSLNLRLHNLNNYDRSQLALTLNSAHQGLTVWDSDDGMAYVWDGSAWLGMFAGDRISSNIIDAKGDLIVGVSDNNVNRLPIGANGFTLIADSTQPLGVRWGTVSGVGEANTASNAGLGIGVVKAKVGVDLQFKSLKGFGNVAVFQYGGDEIGIQCWGEANTASNLGSSSNRKDIYHSKVGEDLRFKSLTAGDGIDLSTAVSGEIKISQTATFSAFSDFTTLTFSMFCRTLFFTGSVTSSIGISSIPEGVECSIVIEANGGDIRIDFPPGDFTPNSITQLTITNGTAIILKVISISGRNFWTYSTSLIQI